MSAPPAFQFYASDFIAGTTSMTAKAVGAYIRLLCHQWMNGNVPSKIHALKLITGTNAKVFMPIIESKFEQKSDENGDRFWINKRLETVRLSQQAFVEKQRENANKRWHKPMPPHDSGINLAYAKPMLSDLRSPISYSTVEPPVPPLPERKGTETQIEVELPPGFPDTIDSALRAADFVGCPKIFTNDVWNKAVGRGGRDSKDVIIRSWRHYLAREWAYEQQRQALDKRNGKVESRQIHEVVKVKSL